MDSMIPEGFPREGRRQAARGEGLVVAVSGGRRYPVLRFDAEGLVVETGGQPPMRGAVDILERGERVAHCLVQLAWSEEDRAGYELKRSSPGKPVPPDFQAALGKK